MKKFTTSEKIWMLSIIFYIIWAVIGLRYEIHYYSISILGSLGMVLFVVLGNLIRFIYGGFK